MPDIRITINPRAETAEVHALTRPGHKWLCSFTYRNPWNANEAVVIAADAVYDYTAAATEAGLEVNAP